MPQKKRSAKRVRLLKRVRAFTIVELLIVLSIASVILTSVFLSVPSALRNHRNYQRKHALELIFSQFNQYAADNRGRYPLGTSNEASSPSTGTWGDFYSNYISGDTDLGSAIDKLSGQSLFPPPQHYDLDYCGVISGPCKPCNVECDNPWGYPVNSSGDQLEAGQASVIVGAVCSGNTPVSADGTTNFDYYSNKVIFIVGLEPVGQYFCIGTSNL
jgi:prepilin-type N-terminal cleavage/methylation domain-containing protein